MTTIKLNTFLSTFNTALIIVGYAVVTTLFLPIEYSNTALSQRITIPFRIVILLFSVYVIILNYGKTKIKNANVLLIIFFVLYIIKLFWHITVKDDTAAEQYENHNQYYLLTIGSIIIPMLSMMYSWNKINISILLRSIIILGIFVLFISFLNNNHITIERNMANMALRSISYGHFAVSIALISLYALLYRYHNKKNYLFILLIGFFFSIFIAFRAGSRSPIVALIIVSIIIIFFKTRYRIHAIFILFVLLFLFAIFINNINSFIGSFSIITDRMELVLEGNSNGRDILIREGWKQFIEHPFIGSDFVIASGPAKGGYPHNIIIEAFMVLGIFGGLLVLLIFIALFQSIRLIKEKNSYALFGILFIQHFIYRMFSLGIYSDNVFFCLLAIILSTMVKDNFHKHLFDAR